MCPQVPGLLERVRALLLPECAEEEWTAEDTIERIIEAALPERVDMYSTATAASAGSAATTTTTWFVLDEVGARLGLSAAEHAAPEPEPASSPNDGEDDEQQEELRCPNYACAPFASLDERVTYRLRNIRMATETSWVGWDVPTCLRTGIRNYVTKQVQHRVAAAAPFRRRGRRGRQRQRCHRSGRGADHLVGAWAAGMGVRAGRFQLMRGPILAEIYLCHACSCHEVGDGNAPGRSLPARPTAGASAMDDLLQGTQHEFLEYQARREFEARKRRHEAKFA
jgi:hypothetical protein